MSALRSVLLDSRRIVSWPLRRWALERLAAEGRAPISVLFYHRVADSVPNDWTISCDLFARQMDWISREFDLVDLPELQRRVRDCDSRRTAVHVSFDDGYAENCDFAIPYLVERGIPCTYFVTLDHIRSGNPFPHDQHAGVPLAVNSFEQLREMSDSGIEIGFHTRSHPDCGGLTDETEFRREIIDAAVEFREHLGRPVRYFAFPYGMPQNIPSAGIQAVREAGFDGFCSAFGAYNIPGQDPLHIRRLHGDPDMARFRNWLSFDPRKLRMDQQLG